MTTATYTFDEHTVSDLHKDACGFRPCQSWWSNWSTMNDSEKQAEWDSLIESMDHREARRVEDEQAAIVRFESLVTKTIKSGASTRVDAIRWLMEGQDGVQGDSQYFEFLMGVPYGYTTK